MLIRKELSIIVGFAVIPHALKRILLVVPGAWNYFADHDTLVAEDRVVSALGQGITNGVFLLGIVMTVLFLVLWVTSFDRIRKRMGYKNGKVCNAGRMLCMRCCLFTPRVLIQAR